LISIHPLEKHHLNEADRIFRLAFGTFMGLPDPMKFMGDAELIRTRWTGDSSGAIGAFEGDELLGSNFATRWGSFAFLGPLTIRPDLWDKGIAKKLLQETVSLFDQWGIRQSGLFTFPHSPKHHALYQKFEFWPQHLTPLMIKQLNGNQPDVEWTAYSSGSPDDRSKWLRQCAQVADEIFPGLNLDTEIRSVLDQNLGDTILIRDNGTISGLAIIHLGKGSEAGTANAYIKFGAVRPGEGAEKRFDCLLAASESLAAQRNSPKITAGVNTARHPAYRQMLARGYRTAFTGVAMLRPNSPGFNRLDCFVIDDWR
jgi:hypothetical protein